MKNSYIYELYLLSCRSIFADFINFKYEWYWKIKFSCNEFSKYSALRLSSFLKRRRSQNLWIFLLNIKNRFSSTRSFTNFKHQMMVNIHFKLAITKFKFISVQIPELKDLFLLIHNQLMLIKNKPRLAKIILVQCL